MYDKYMSWFLKIGKQWVLIVLIALLFFMVLGLNSSIADLFRLGSQRDEMQSRIENLESTRSVLETEIAYANSEKAVEEWARTFGHMILPGDEMIIPLPPSDVTPEINYMATPTPQMNENWQIWWELLFGE